MRNKITLGSIILFTLVSLGQTTAAGQDLATTVRAQYANKMLCFRHFFRSDSQEYSHEGKLLKKSPEGSWTYYGQIMANKVDLADDAVRFEGNRVVYKFDEHAEHLIPVQTEENVKVTIHLMSPATTLEQITVALGKVFTATEEERVNSVPPEWRSYLTGHSASLDPPGVAKNIDDTKSEPIYNLGDPGVTRPKIVSQPIPDFPPGARNTGGVVGLTAVVDRTGRVRDVKVVHPAGKGMDESAILAVKAWRFKPATRDGVPVAVHAYLEVDFHLYQ
jgi:TonB family protein